MATFTKWKCLGYGKCSLEINEYNTGNKLSTFAKWGQRAREFPKDGGSFRWWAPDARWNSTETKVLRLASGEEEKRAGPWRWESEHSPCRPGKAPQLILPQLTVQSKEVARAAFGEELCICGWWPSSIRLPDLLGMRVGALTHSCGPQSEHLGCASVSKTPNPESHSQKGPWKSEEISIQLEGDPSDYQQITSVS